MKSSMKDKRKRCFREDFELIPYAISFSPGPHSLFDLESQYCDSETQGGLAKA
jgi:hypothetical protein